MIPARKIIHVDMDAFYASVEQLDHPDLRGKPLAVGGAAEKRGVVAAASYEARKYGVRSAMPTSEALRRCSKLIMVPPRFQRYREISELVHQVFHTYTDLIEPVSLDEAWLDITENSVQEFSGIFLAQRIKKEILQETGLTCSAGVSYNKFLAKIASNENKPDGLFVITPDQAREFLKYLPVRKIPGVGRVTEEKLKKLGIEVGEDVLDRDSMWLSKKFGKFGSVLYHRVRGVDDRPVEPHRASKSVSVETTFNQNLAGFKVLKPELEKLIEKLIVRCRRHGLYGTTMTLKMKFSNFDQVTRSESRDHPYDYYLLKRIALLRLRRCCDEEFSGQQVRLLGLALSNFPSTPIRAVQLDLFESVVICT